MINLEPSNVMTSSRMNCMAECARAHFWAYEVGLEKDAESGAALRFGSAWHRGMDARWNGLKYDATLAAAIPEGCVLDEWQCATLSAMLAGYFERWGPVEKMGKLHAEQQFDYDLPHGFKAQGKIDGLGSFKNNLSVLFESKTTSEDISQGSDYWIRLRFNVQVLNYTLAAMNAGWDITKVIYDVARKPQLRPLSKVYEKDSAGLLMVEDKLGKRVFNKTGRFAGQPRQSEDESQGFALRWHEETPDEYCDRVYEDIKAYPDFYFCRREVAVLDGDLRQFEYQRLALIKDIVAKRENQKGMKHPEDAWPRNVGEDNCKYCDYRTFCLQNVHVDPKRPPQGFIISEFHPELNENKNTITA